MKYEKAVKEARTIVGRVEKDLWRLAQIAYELEPKYGEQTLARFADDIGLSFSTVRYYKRVYERFGHTDQNVGYPPFWTAKELLSVPYAAQIIEQYPDITQPEARTFAKEYRELSEEEKEELKKEREEGHKMFEELFEQIRAAREGRKPEPSPSSINLVEMIKQCDRELIKVLKKMGEKGVEYDEKEMCSICDHIQQVLDGITRKLKCPLLIEEK
jgi:hypothetical protein